MCKNYSFINNNVILITYIHYGNLFNAQTDEIADIKKATEVA